MIKQRLGIILYLNPTQSIKPFAKYGTIHYYSLKYRYLVMYINADDKDNTLRKLEKNPLVKSVLLSYRDQLDF